MAGHGALAGPGAAAGGALVAEQHGRHAVGRPPLRRDDRGEERDDGGADGGVPNTRHPLADRDDIPIAHVTYFNRTFYDNGRAPTTVIEHGIVDPGERWTGELERAAVVVNEPVRR